MTRSKSPRDGSQFWASRGPELVDALRDTMTQIRVLQARALDLVAEMDREQVAPDAGYSSLAGFLVEAIRVAPPQAQRMVAHAAQITETVTPTGHVTPAALPTVRVGMLEGVLDADHLDVVAKTVKQLPAWVSVADREVVESTLASQARTADAWVVRSLGKELLTRIDQDGPPPDEQELAQPVNSLRYRRTHTGRMVFTADIDPEAGEELEGLLTALAKPTAQDERHRTQRLGDAMAEVVHLAAKAEDLPVHGGEKPHLTVTLDYNALLEGIGTATLEGGALLCPKSARRIACDAHILPIVLNGTSVPLDVGRKYRFVTPDQRRALVARDKGCAYPGCHRPPRWADAHHIKHWLDGGLTDLDNMVLLCRGHHRLIHHSEWDVKIVGGLPIFYPPKWLDPQRKGIRNTLHHPRE
jgi:hypothetical protein